MMLARCAILCAGSALAVLWMCGVGGCASRNPWTFITPPTRVEPSPAMRAERKTIIVVGEFADPSGARPYAVGVGRFMSDAFSRALLNDGNYDVWINPQLSREAEFIAQRTGQWSEISGQRADSRGRTAIAANQPVTSDVRPPSPGSSPGSSSGSSSDVRPVSSSKVHYVVLGKVTDFLYTGDLPAQVSRRGVAPPWGRRNEAIVAIDLRIVDMRTRRVVGADHIRATVPAGRTDANELHGAVPFDSYLFWSTPLGRAGKQAIETAVAQTEAVVPPPLIDPQIEKMIAWRRVSIIGGSMAGVSQGQELYVLTQPWSGDGSATVASRAADGRGEGNFRGWRPVRDAHTGHPLMVRIDTVSRTHSTGWLLGERPLEVSLRGALLSTELPPEQPPLPEPEQGPLANMPAAVREGG